MKRKRTRAPKFAVGDLIRHEKAPELLFRVVRILENADPGSTPAHLYNCEQLKIVTLKTELNYDDGTTTNHGRLTRVGHLVWDARASRRARAAKRPVVAARKHR